MIRRVVIGALAAMVVALVIGIPTGVVETPWYTRMTPVLWWNYPVWALSSMLTGTLVATYVRDPAVPVPPSEGGKRSLEACCRCSRLAARSATSWWSWRWA